MGIQAHPKKTPCESQVYHQPRKHPFWWAISSKHTVISMEHPKKTKKRAKIQSSKYLVQQLIMTKVPPKKVVKNTPNRFKVQLPKSKQKPTKNETQKTAEIHRTRKNDILGRATKGPQKHEKNTKKPSSKKTTF